ncbi:uncharacterized protein [Euwallacea similis]|uniref:uncharacterized protein n=1 Tax=Euwallacea similis TaxID=1736056 RepID=UPI00344D3A23
MITGRILDLVIVALLVLLAESKPARSRNLIFSQPGAVAVYVRSGDTPLKDIDPELAEAFEFNAIKHGRLAFGRQINEIINEKEKSFNSAQLAEGESYTVKKKRIGKHLPSTSGESYIQKIPRS